MQWIFWYDWVLTFLLTVIVLIWAASFVKKNSSDKIITGYFKKGLLLKIVGCIAYGVYHAYVYKGGDTFTYYHTAKQVEGYLFTDFERFIKLTFYSVDKSMDVRDDDSWLDYVMVLSESNTFQVRLAAIIQIFTFGTYLPTSLVFSLLSYIGIWKCFKTFCRIYPGKEKYLSIPFLFIPTVVFWGSGLGKDCVCLASICLLTTASYYCFVFKERVFRNLIAIILFGSILLIVKAYIAFAFLPPLFLALALNRLKKIKNPIFKVILFPVSIGSMIVAILLVLQFASTNFSRYLGDDLAEKIVENRDSMKSSAGSLYDLGIKAENINGLMDLAPFFPKAVVATLFRPWLWEAKNPAMLLSGLEGFFFLVLFIYVLIKGRIFKPFGIVLSDPILFSSAIYVLIFSGLVALSTGNFGTLVRYKLPCMPFWGLLLFMVLSKLKDDKKSTKDTGSK
ncbi:hypothetical protein LK994_03585 [Ferruginibacter lapsinanis]|uniref:hypothetical protein n=1 Tax=Ferruginibacter lapsinanis TaxID=563172 RepID=UPI001E3839DF|nr:hypothetical protein [Ferruginibacter lapsinanis]UEG50551.1 hypothetical protein LK994_03585 [Ferruginibacter lapsinanis]